MVKTVAITFKKYDKILTVMLYYDKGVAIFYDTNRRILLKRTGLTRVELLGIENCIKKSEKVIIDVRT